MNDTKVTIILPSLNVASYIGATLKSAMDQSLKGLEIICVDAGSTDGTLEIIEEYKEICSQKTGLSFTILHSDMRSYGHQVNMGFAAAKGEYIGILETDDIADSKMYEDLYNLGKKYDADIIKSTYFDYFGEAKAEIRLKDGNTISGKARPSLLSAIRAPKKVFKIYECPELLLHHPSVWSALYKRSFLEEKQIKMPEIPGAGWADNPFFIESLIKAERITYTPKAYYYYRKDNPGSSTALKNCHMPFERITEMREILENVIPKNDSAFATINRTIDHRAINYAVDAASSAALDKDKDIPFIKDCLSHIPEEYLDDCHITSAEREAYNFFTGKAVKDSFKHKVRKLLYTAKYGFSYIFNNLDTFF